MKNADVIRSMTDKQLDEFLAQFELGDVDYAVTFCDWCKEDGNELGLDCDGCRTHWLTEDASSYNGLNGWLRHNGFEPYTEDVCNMIDKRPTVDAAEVVRCRNCKNWQEWENGTGSCHRSENGYNWFGVDATDYCSFGVRREDGE